MNGKNINNAPSTSVVIPFYMIGAMFWLITTLIILLNAKNLNAPSFHPLFLGLTHFTVLGFISTIIFGALHQLLPVIFLTKLYSEMLAKFSLFTIVAGTLIMATSMIFVPSSSFQLTGGILLWSSFLAYSINIAATFFTKPTGKIEGLLILSAAINLFITSCLGIVMLLNRFTDITIFSNFKILPLHILFGTVGWMMQLIIGVSSVLLPMFFLNHKPNRSFLRITFIGIHLALISGLLSLLLVKELFYWAQIIFVLIAALGYLLFIFKSYKGRVKKKLDAGMTLTVRSFISLLAVSFLLIAVNSPFVDLFSSLEIWKIIGFTFFFGFVALLIFGQTFKTLPFIVWLHQYKGLIGKKTIPYPKDLYSERSILQLHYIHVGGLLLLLFGILSKLQLFSFFGAVLFVTAAVLYVIQVVKIVNHKSV